jgi:hypothetical protein
MLSPTVQVNSNMAIYMAFRQHRWFAECFGYLESGPFSMSGVSRFRVSHVRRACDQWQQGVGIKADSALCQNKLLQLYGECNSGCSAKQDSQMGTPIVLKSYINNLISLKPIRCEIWEKNQQQHSCCLF